jgi:hypothetical protein
MAGEDDVLELEIPVRNVLLRVKVLEAEEELEEDPLGFCARERALLDEVAEEVAAGDAVGECGERALVDLTKMDESNGQLEEDGAGSEGKSARASSLEHTTYTLRSEMTTSSTLLMLGCTIRCRVSWTRLGQELRTTTHVREVLEDSDLALDVRDVVSDQFFAQNLLAGYLLEGLSSDALASALLASSLSSACTHLDVQSQMNDAERPASDLAIKDEIISNLLRLARPSGLTLTSRLAPRLREAKDLTRDVDLVAVAEDDGGLVHATIVVHRAIGRDVLEADEDVARVGFELREKSWEVSSEVRG